MQWAIAELINNPKVYKIARDEIESVVGTTRLVEETDIPNLNYVQAIVKETLRLHPNTPIIPRVCRENCKISGFDIPRNTPVAVNVYSCHNVVWGRVLRKENGVTTNSFFRCD